MLYCINFNVFVSDVMHVSKTLLSIFISYKYSDKKLHLHHQQSRAFHYKYIYIYIYVLENI